MLCKAPNGWNKSQQNTNYSQRFNDFVPHQKCFITFNFFDLLQRKCFFAFGLVLLQHRSNSQDSIRLNKAISFMIFCMIFDQLPRRQIYDTNEKANFSRYDRRLDDQEICGLNCFLGSCDSSRWSSYTWSWTSHKIWLKEVSWEKQQSA